MGIFLKHSGDDKTSPAFVCTAVYIYTAIWYNSISNKFRRNTMDIKLELLKEVDKPLLVRLMELYNYEFTQYDDADISEYGYYGYAHIDDYWNEDGRYPYLIRVDGKIAGFALICPHCRFIENEVTHSIGEFFVMIKYRRNGVGEYVAKELFTRHKGKWEVCHMHNNEPAADFWRRVITEYTNGDLETAQDNEMFGYIFST